MTETLAYFNADRSTLLLKASLRRIRDAYTDRAGEPPCVDILSSSALLILRERQSNPQALAAMHIGLRALAEEILAERLN